MNKIYYAGEAICKVRLSGFIGTKIVQTQIKILMNEWYEYNSDAHASQHFIEEIGDPEPINPNEYILITVNETCTDNANTSYSILEIKEVLESYLEPTNEVYDE